MAAPRHLATWPHPSDIRRQAPRFPWRRRAGSSRLHRNANGDDSALYRSKVAHHALDFFRRLCVRDLVVGIFTEKLVAPHRHVPGTMSAQVRLPIDYPVDLIGWKFAATLCNEGQVGYRDIEDGGYGPIARRDEAVTTGAGNTELPLPAFDDPRVLWRCIMSPTRCLAARATGERCNGEGCECSCDDFQDSSVVRACSPRSSLTTSVRPRI